MLLEGRREFALAASSVEQRQAHLHNAKRPRGEASRCPHAHETAHPMRKTHLPVIPTGFPRFFDARWIQQSLASDRWQLSPPFPI